MIEDKTNIKGKLITIDFRIWTTQKEMSKSWGTKISNVNNYVREQRIESLKIPHLKMTTLVRREEVDMTAPVVQIDFKVWTTQAELARKWGCTTEYISNLVNKEKIEYYAPPCLSRRKLVRKDEIKPSRR